ncbi:MAG: threonine dehydratase [Chloroflexi bacterium]|nr:MAG: threonine dehydratase [Chloroflexota bacterium]
MNSRNDSVLPVSFADLLAARPIVAALARETPVVESRRLSEELGAPIALKVEVLQRAGSFKVRGAANFVASLDGVARARGVIAASAGNHAQGLALAAVAAGVPCQVVMPHGTALPKEQATREYGAQVRLAGADLGEAAEVAQALAMEHEWAYVPPFDDPRIVAGQGTLGLELLEQIPDLGVAVVPVGGGSLAAGVGLALKHQRPGIRVVGVQAAAVPSAARSHGQDQPQAVPARWTLADGCAVPRVGAVTLPLLNAYVDEIVTVSEESIGSAIVWLLERSNLVVEGAGALGVAALLSGAVDPGGRRTAVVLSGGNIDINTIAKTVEYGLARAGRYVRLVATVPDRPGQLAAVLRSVSEQGANVLQVEHHRRDPSLPVGAVNIALLLEVRGVEHSQALVGALGERGYERVGAHPGEVHLVLEGLSLEEPSSDGAP